MASSAPTSVAPIQGRGKLRWRPRMYVWKPPFSVSDGSESTPAVYAPAAWKMMKLKLTIPETPNWRLIARHARMSTAA